MTLFELAWGIVWLRGGRAEPQLEGSRLTRLSGRDAPRSSPAAGLAAYPDTPARAGAKFSRESAAILEADGVAVKRLGPYAPNLNAYAERWVQSAQQECLDHSVVFGEAHRRHLLTAYVAHYNGKRPHQMMGNAPLSGEGSSE